MWMPVDCEEKWDVTTKRSDGKSSARSLATLFDAGRSGDTIFPYALTIPFSCSRCTSYSCSCRRARSGCPAVSSRSSYCLEGHWSLPLAQVRATHWRRDLHHPSRRQHSHAEVRFRVHRSRKQDPGIVSVTVTTNFHLCA